MPLEIPEKYRAVEKASWPIDWGQRYYTIMDDMYRCYDAIDESDPIWDLVDKAKSDRLVVSMKADRTNKIYRKNYRKFNYLLLVQRFMKMHHT